MFLLLAVSPFGSIHSHTAPNSPPDNVTAMANSSTSIIVTWDMVPLVDQNGIILYYLIQYKPLETFGGLISSQRYYVTGLETTAVLMNLEEFVDYNISIRAYNSAGWGPYSTDITATTEEDGKMA